MYFHQQRGQVFIQSDMDISAARLALLQLPQFVCTVFALVPWMVESSYTPLHGL